MDQSAAEQSQQHSQADFGVCWGWHRPRPHHSMCPIKDSHSLLGCPGHPWWRGPALLSPSPPLPPHSLEQLATVPREGLGRGLTSRGAGLVRGCRGCKGCRGSAASGSGCSETSCKARRAGAVSVGDGWRWWPLGGTVPWVRRGPGAQSGGDMGWGCQAGKVRQSWRGCAEDSRDTAVSKAVAGKDSGWSGAVAGAVTGRARGYDCRRKDQDLRPGGGDAAG